MKKIEQFFKWSLLNLLLFINPKIRSTGNENFSCESKILFIRLNRIGDALITTPLLDLVKKEFNCSIYILADRKNYFIFENNPSIDEVIIFDKSINGIFGINKIIKSRKIDTVVDLHDDVSTTVSFIIAIAKVRNKFGLKKSNSKIFTKTVERINSSKHHIIERTLRLSSLFNLPVNKNYVSIHYYPKMESIKYADSEIEKRIRKNKFLLGINLFTGSEARFWGVDNFKKLIEQVRKYEISYILFSTQDKLEIAKNITEEKFIYPPSKEFDTFAAGISKLNFLFTPDTSVVHIASIYKIPVFGLYVKYNTQDIIWSPYNTEFDCIVTEEPTLKNVSFEEVINKFIPFLERNINVQRNSFL
ncbi:MAG: glycosyltransferase family 9 protein [Ignavibacteria bacterium]|nr:glycosyltransferase family 9 protein [Ignavibacteria bacterium]